MGRLIYSFNVSLDGYIETVDKSLDWSLISDEVHGYFNDQTRALDASLYGRRLWDLMSGHWPTAEDDPDSNEVMRDFARVVERHAEDRVLENARPRGPRCPSREG